MPSTLIRAPGGTRTMGAGSGSKRRPGNQAFPHGGEALKNHSPPPVCSDSGHSRPDAAPSGDVGINRVTAAYRGPDCAICAPVRIYEHTKGTRT
jgi:hypothetical protein